LKKLLYVLLAIVVLLVAAVLVLPGLIDWNAYKQQLADQVERVTGRQVEIVGNVELSMLPSPSLNVERLALRNLSGGSAENMAEVGALRVRVALAPLLQGRVAVERVALIEPRILLERLDDGRVNWRFQGLGGQAPSAGGDGLLRQVRLDSLQVVDATLVYRDHAADVAEQVTGLDAELSAESLAGPFRIDGTGEFRAVPLRVRGTLGRLSGAGPTPYNLTVALPEGGGQANLSGTLDPTDADGARLQGDLAVTAPQLAPALARLAGRRADSFPGQLDRPFRLEADLAYAGGTLRGDGLAVALGETSADGSFELALGPTPDARVKLTAQRVRLDRLVAPDGDGDGSGAEGAGNAGPGGTGLGAIPMPTGLRAELDLQVGALLWRDQVIRQGRLNAVLANGEITLNQAMALLPGSSDFALFGTLAQAEGQPPVFDGRVEAASDNLRAVFDWLGVDVSGVPSDRLRRLSLLADIRGTPQQVTLTGIDLNVDTMDISGGVAIALRQRPGFGIGLTVDSLNLDAYLPSAEGTASGDGEPPDTGAPDAADATPLGFLGGFDANFDLRAGQITYGGRSARRVALDATLHNQALKVRELSVADFAGARASLAGDLRGLVGLDPSFELDLDLDVRAPRRLAQAFGLGDSVPADLDAMALVGTISGNPATVDLDATATAFGGSVTARGTVKPLAPDTPFDLTLQARHDSLADLTQRVPWLPAAPAATGNVRLDGRVVGTQRRLRTERLEGRIAGVELAGPVAVQLDGPRPRIEAQLETGPLPAALFGAAARGGSGGAGAGDAGGGTRWSSQPLDLAGLRAVDGTLTLDAAALALGRDLRLEQVRLVASLDGGVLDIDRLAGDLLDGSLTLSGTLDAVDTPALSLRTEARDVAAAALLTRAFGRPVLDGPVTATAELTAKGRSERALVESLQGDGALSGEVTVQARALLGPQGARLLQSSDGAGQLGRLLGEAFGQEVRIQGVQQALDFVGRSFTQAPASLAGTFTVADGIVRSDDLRLEGADGLARLDGRINLPNWRMDARTRLYRPQDGRDSPFVVARQVGPLDAPNVSVTGGAFRQSLGSDTRDNAPDEDTTAPDATDSDAAAPDAASPGAAGSEDAAEAEGDGATAQGAEPDTGAPQTAPAPAPEKPDAETLTAPEPGDTGQDTAGPTADDADDSGTRQASGSEGGADGGDGGDGEGAEAGGTGGSNVDDIIRGILEEGAQ
jgi:uncharacterized protein involved in outer membrane biogenesis